MRLPIDILKQYWGHASFRPLQKEIIESVLEGKDTLALLPTGGGKSVCFQIPALCLGGICIVISPLIALMKDQVEQLNLRGIRAAAVFSGMSKREIDITLDNCIYGNMKFLYVSPERLKTELFLERARQMKISLLAVDEAHCISQWGYDFRPPYLEIADFKEAFSIPRLIALTATATKEVKEDILSKLGMRDPAVFQRSFARSNLSYSVFELENKEQKMRQILQNVAGSAIVYVRSRKQTQKIANMLQRNGISADYYHAGLPGKERAQKQDQWINNQKRVMVATNAFGMGIDKPDVRSVIHMDLPDSLEAYYQEAGRAGRDEKKAYAVALFHQQDANDLIQQTSESAVTIQQLRRTYQALANYYQLAIGSYSFVSCDFNFTTFVQTYNLSAKPTFSALKKLNDEGLIQLSDGFYDQSKLLCLLEKPRLYEYQVANPKLDPLLKTVLRLSGGELFSNYMKIRESEIARLLKTSEAQVRKWLQYLHEQEVVDYQSSSDQQQITFLTARLEPASLPIDQQQLNQRRKLAIEKAKAVVNYMTSNDCRTNIFQRYFDEVPEGVCGICDNDIAQKKTERKTVLSPYELLVFLDAPRSLQELLNAFNAHQEQQIVEALRILIEDGKVQESEKGFIKR